MAGEAGLETPALWWNRVGRGRSPLAVVIGARKAGKTSFFQRVAADPGQHVRLWPVIGAARLRSPGEVWRELWQLLGVPAPEPGDEPRDYLKVVLDSCGHSVTLVVDEWDRAIDRRGVAESPDACYSVLDELVRFCMDQDRNRRGAGHPRLGLVLVTSLPTARDLTIWARDVTPPRYDRLSGLLTRVVGVERFPLLDQADSEAVLVAAGVSRKNARRAANACGGWLWLLGDAAAAIAKFGGWTEKAVEYLRDVCVPEALDASVLPFLARRPEVGAAGPAATGYLAAELAAGVPPLELGVPAAFDAPAYAAPLIRQHLIRTYLVVDTENLRMPFEKDVGHRPAQYPLGLDAFLQPLISRWLRSIAERHLVDDRDIMLVGVSRQRILGTVGPDFPESTPYYLSADQQRKGKRSGRHNDDSLLTALVAQRAERHRLARFVIVAGDRDHPALLATIGALRNVTVYAPWGVSPVLRELMRGAGELVENDLGEARPPDYDD